MIIEAISSLLFGWLTIPAGNLLCFLSISMAVVYTTIKITEDKK